MAVIVDGNITVDNFWQLLNAELLIVKSSGQPDRLIASSELHSEKADSPSWVRLNGNNTR